ncbi:phosphatidate cytidylyltransferase [Thioclava sp. SK-1]|uniref:phosphatidate cytidylyltransferase n=1 Tax=Thioclava sp. SK-1 TaxID=1889770 RepID=UPI0008254E33|nr:phosphatidate cytidylyltransferase [Thioclava sp. SK-1]OCX67094.1 phosphatidate cytidylyltransferase [Thioclava sp. SK-1]
MTQPTAGRWGDLRKRMLSAIVMVLIGGVAIFWGGLAFAGLACIVTGLMIWELSAMTAPDRVNRAILLGVIAALTLALVLFMHSPFFLALLILPPIAGLWRPRRDRRIFTVYALAMMLTGYGLVALRETQGVGAITWIISVVVVSDVAGYFVGRIMGGPKFWPKISPKKTWSGTVAGWVGAALLGVVFYMAGGGAGLIWLSPLVAFAGQLGDIAESWIKRRSAVKDSSTLIPGHGGVMDRFDALIGAVLLLLLIASFGPLPLTSAL